jgi:cytochrome c'
MPSLPRSILASALLVALSMPGMAQQHGGMPGMTMDETKSSSPYHPGLGDLMTAFVQPRHIKLGLAADEHNWDYAAYELGELREAFEQIGKLVPKHGNLAIPPAIAATVTPAMAALDTAIKAKDPAAFTKAFGELTASCNACHQSADHPMIVIQMPTVSAFPDQDFRPPKP